VWGRGKGEKKLVCGGGGWRKKKAGLGGKDVEFPLLSGRRRLHLLSEEERGDPIQKEREGGYGPGMSARCYHPGVDRFFRGEIPSIWVCFRPSFRRGGLTHIFFTKEKKKGAEFKGKKRLSIRKKKGELNS